MKINEICNKYSHHNLNIDIKIIEDDEGNSDMVLIQGSELSLKMISELFLAISDGVGDSSFSMSPFGAGRKHFAKISKFGIYINKTA